MALDVAGLARWLSAVAPGMPGLVDSCALMPTSADLPPIRVFFEEIPYARGPAGAKGIGELPLDGTAPAIANAIANATGANITRIPVTPEVLLEMPEGVHA